MTEQRERSPNGPPYPETESRKGQKAAASDLSRETEVDLLKQEWSGVLALFTSQCEQYSPKITFFGALVLGGITFAMKDPKFDTVYVMIPLLILMIGYMTVAHAYFIIVLAGQMGLIEKRISQLNGGIPVLQTDHRIWRTLMIPPIVRFKLQRPVAKNVRMINPLLGTT